MLLKFRQLDVAKSGYSYYFPQTELHTLARRIYHDFFKQPIDLVTDSNAVCLTQGVWGNGSIRSPRAPARVLGEGRMARERSAERIGCRRGAAFRSRRSAFSRLAEHHFQERQIFA